MKSENEIRDLVIEAGHELVEKKLIARTWGNISARLDDEYFVITPSGRAYEDLTPEDLVKVKISDCTYDGDIKPSSEKGIHQAAYVLRPDVNVVIHTHQFFASTVSAECKGTPFAPCAAYGLSGTKKLRNNVAYSIKQNPESKTILMARHGAMIMGEDFQHAFSLADDLEVKCETLVNERIPSMDTTDFRDLDTEAVDVGHPFVLLNKDQYVNECCLAGINLKAYIDDFAQIVGPEARCCGRNKARIKKAAKGRNAVIVKRAGALCFADTPDDAEAVSMIVSKNCAAACYVRKGKPLSKVDAMLQRIIYTKKYSKEKDVC